MGKQNWQFVIIAFESDIRKIGLRKVQYMNYESRSQRKQHIEAITMKGIPQGVSYII